MSFGGSSLEDSRNPNFENQALRQSLSRKKGKGGRYKVIEPKEFKLSFDRGIR